MKTHTVQPTRDGRYAVLAGKETLAVMCDEAAAILAANALNSEPVRSIESRWLAPQEREFAA